MNQKSGMLLYAIAVGLIVIGFGLEGGVSQNQLKQAGANRGSVDQRVYFVSATQSPAVQIFAPAGQSCQYSEVFRNGIKQYSPREFALTPDGMLMFPGTIEPDDTVETLCFH